MVRAEAIITLTVDIHRIDVCARLLHYDRAASRVTHLAFYSNCGTPGGHLDTS